MLECMERFACRGFFVYLLGMRLLSFSFPVSYCRACAEKCDCRPCSFQEHCYCHLCCDCHSQREHLYTFFLIRILLFLSPESRLLSRRSLKQTIILPLIFTSSLRYEKRLPSFLMTVDCWIELMKF